MDNLGVNQLVWGKVRGHPWWPGIITSVQGSEYKIEFIAEFTHDYLRAGSLRLYENTPENVKKVKNKVRLIKRLHIAINFADKIHSGAILVNSVEALNHEIENSVKESKVKGEKKENPGKIKSSCLKDIKDLFKKCLKSAKIMENCSGFVDFQRVLDIIRAAEENNSSVNSLQVHENFFEVLSKFPKIPIKICRYLLKVCVDNENKFGKLASVAEDFQVFWKSLRNQEKLEKEMGVIHNPVLRKHVCRKLAQKLQTLGVVKRESQIRAINIEQSIRDKYPDMKEDYIRKSKLILKQMKEKLAL